jgi:hypothetical protein
MKTRNYIMATVIAVGLFVSTSSSAATIAYGNWSESGSETVIPTFTVNDDYEGKFKVSVNIDKANSPNDFAKITGIYFDLGDDIISQADITGELVTGSLSGYTHFASNDDGIKGVTLLNLGDFETILGYKSKNNKAGVPVSFFVSDHDGALTLNDWGKVGVRFQSVGINGFGEGSDKEISTESQLVAPIPAAVWLFGSGLIGLVGMTKRCKNNNT